MNKESEKNTSNNMNNKILVAIIIVVVAAGGFFAGMKYQKSQVPSAADAGAFISRQGGQGGAGGFRRFGGNNQNGQAVRGQIVSADNGTVTVKLADGSTKIIVLSDNTNITKAAAGTRDDLRAGEQVMVFGSNNSDGSVTAQVVQLNPMARRRPSGNPSPATNQ